ncbi:MAG: CinA family nicotinamide mononucleotide deamidase-related protein [Deltaproteobacteria bacterium]|nr:CinA family nicotinamide mononucleotide deamidase-related protein [Deltaproteobacteria bacterium]
MAPRSRPAAVNHPRVIVIATGDEVLHGEIVNGNAAWLAAACRDTGYVVTRHVAVGDDTAAIAAAAKEAARAAPIVLVTGGLGATVDDLTLAAAAKAFRVPLRFQPALWAAIRAFFATVGRPCAATNKRQAYLPRGGEALANAIGTAPGVRARFGRAMFFFLPGVPAEMRRIFTDHVRPWLRAQAAGPAPQLRVLRAFGLPEATLDERLRRIRFGEVRIGFRATFPEVRIKLSCAGVAPAPAARLLDAAEAAVRARVGEYIYGVGEEGLPEVVVRGLIAKRWTIAVAESCTGGYLADLCTNVAGSSQCFEWGIVAYSNAAKTALLAVPTKLIAAHGAVSAEVACAMAEGARRSAGTTLGLGVTGIAGPTGGTADKPIGTVYLALAHATGINVQHYCSPRPRREFKMLVGYTALDMVRKL